MKTKKAIPLLFSLLAVASIGILGNTSSVYAQIPPEWSATTDSDPQGDLDAPVDNPVDTVNIIADANFLGTFSGTWFLDDSTGAQQTGPCTGGVVDAFTGEAILNCNASGLGPYGVVGSDTCWTIVIVAPAGYDPAADTLDGTGIAEECFTILPQVAGELLPLDSTALFLAGIQSMTVWMIPTVLGLAGAGIYLVKFRARD